MESFAAATKTNLPRGSKLKVPERNDTRATSRDEGRREEDSRARDTLVISTLTRLNVNAPPSHPLRISHLVGATYALPRERLIISSTTLYLRYVLALGKRSSLTEALLRSNQPAENISGERASGAREMFEIYCQDAKDEGEKDSRPWT